MPFPQAFHAWLLSHRTLRDGSLIADFQALRAWLPSFSPSGARSELYSRHCFYNNYQYANETGYPRFVVKLASYIVFVAVAVSLLFREVEWPWVAFRQGDTAFRDGHYRDAAAFYERAAQKLDDPRIGERVATCWLRLNRPDQAEEALARLLRPGQNQLPTIKLLAGLYQRDQQPEKAIPLFSEYLSRHGKLDPSGKLQLARIYRQASLYDEAAPYYSRAAEDPKQKVVAETELADMRSWEGRYDEAIDLFREVLATEPSNRRARLSLARVLSWAGRYQDSENEYRRVLSKQ